MNVDFGKFSGRISKFREKPKNSPLFYDKNYNQVFKRVQGPNLDSGSGGSTIRMHHTSMGFTTTPGDKNSVEKIGTGGGSFHHELF